MHLHINKSYAGVETHIKTGIESRVGGETLCLSPLWIYLMALLYFTKVITCSTIAEAFDNASHDRLTRMLNSPWSGPMVRCAFRLPTACGRKVASPSTIWP